MEDARSRTVGLCGGIGEGALYSFCKGECDSLERKPC